MKIPSTKSIVENLSYIAGNEAFLGASSSAWDAVRCQVLKLETRSFYAGESQSWEAWKTGDRKTSIALIPKEHADDIQLYEDLKKRGVDFIRCRPAEFPLNEYLAWEFENYRFNQKHGERIFVCNAIASKDIFQSYALHDFMTFDERLAAIYDYGSDGELKGGWVTDREDQIIDLMALFVVIKSRCQTFDAIAG